MSSHNAHPLDGPPGYPRTKPGNGTEADPVAECWFYAWRGLYRYHQ